MKNDVIEKLETWGCDTESALERFEGDKELYSECLDIFAGDKNFESLESALADKNFDEAFNEVHALKGVAGNLSLGPLYKAIAVVSDFLKNSENEAAMQAYPALVAAKEEYKKILDSCK